ncbi:bifunctional metallophosphatase/5'-nucleotidase [Trueperella pecoris]|uniref:Bifunctional metallophosphatase/5'-nucleotidase n=1 Tax=Trueperella pecoris TaxID=2733571 RepID=A0A7M1R0C5_9ACTO|nr:bifunctional UDP-sugar hydrolase/5'-nucleotidase [Trueperella pecoris]QOR47719.1 bifunctional metallophosphatase/5'-nucleotidase [Trueperella pecoris]
MKRLAIGAVAAASLVLSPAAALAAPETDTTTEKAPVATEEASPAAEGEQVDADKKADTEGEKEADKDAAEMQEAGVVTLDLYNLTDIHGHIEKVTSKDKKTQVVTVKEAGLAAMSCYVKKAKEDNPNSQLVLLGDNIGASPFTSGSQDDNPTIKALNEMGVFASTIGNHEFDKGQDVLRARIAGTKVGDVTYEKVNFPYLGANLKGMEEIGAYEVWTSPSGVKVAFIGALEDDAPTKVFEGTFNGITFEKPVKVINDLAKKIKDNKEADVVIAMYDNDVKRSYPKMGEYVDGIMGGDTHVPYYFTKEKTEEGREISATASGKFTDNLANLQIKVDLKTRKVVDSQAIKITAEDVVKACPEGDPAVVKVVDEAKKISDEKGAEVIADGVGNFYRGKLPNDGENRGTESTIGGLIADAMRSTFTTLDGKPLDIGIINAGGIRNDLLPEGGKVTIKNVFDVQPFSNEVGYVSMTGAQFKTLLEQQWKELDAAKGSTRPMLKLGLSQNVKYTFDPAKEKGQRITSVLINDEPIVDDQTYTVGSVTFLLQGNDSFDVLKDVKDTLTTIPDGLDRDFFGKYLTENPKVQPRDAVQSVGVTLVDPKVDGMKVTTKVNLRGLSFSGPGESQTKTVTVKLGDQTATATVNNTLEDKNAADYSAIVTADGVGYLDQPVELSATATCGDSAKAHLPLTVTDDKGNVLVGEAAGLGVDVTCEGKTDPTDPVDPTPAVPTLDINRDKVAQGDSVTFTAKGLAPEEAALITVHSETVVVFAGKADAKGMIEAKWTVPSDFEVGEHLARLTTDNAKASVKFNVVGAKVPNKPADPLDPNKILADKIFKGLLEDLAAQKDDANKVTTGTTTGKPAPKLAHTGTEAMSLMAAALLFGAAGTTLIAVRRKGAK